MSRDDYEEDDRPRRRRPRDDDDYDDVSRPSRARNGSVTSVGVISIILGSLTLLCGLCLVIGSVTFLAAAPVGPGPQFGPARGPNFLPFQIAGAVLVVIAILVLVFGVLYLVGGIGVVQRRNWGRIMTLVMGGFSILFGVLQIVGVVTTIANPLPMEHKIVPILINLLCAGVLFTHGIMAFVVLLNSRNAAEFE